MNKFLTIPMLAAMIFLPSVAFANRLDLSTVKCGEWMEGSKEEIGLTVAWLGAYYMGDDDPPVMDFDKMKTDAGKLGKFCAANPDLGLGTAAEKVLGGKK